MQLNALLHPWTGAWRRILLAITWIIVTLLFMASSASAQSSDPCRTADKRKLNPVIVDLNVEQQEGTPSHLCIVSREAVPDALRIEEKLKTLESKWYTKSPDQLVYGMDSHNWQVLSNGRSWRMPDTHQGDSCTGLLEICEPAFALQRRQDESHYIQCVANDKPFDDKLRVVVLMFDAHTGSLDVTHQPLICGPRLDRTTVTFSIEMEPGATSRVIGSVIGGHYVEGPARTFQHDAAHKGEKMELPLARRCQEHEIALPPAAGAANANVTLNLREKSSDSSESSMVAQCRQPISPNGHFKMSLPYMRNHTRRSVEVEAGSVKNRTVARYEGSWFDFQPPAVLQLRHAAISFRWRRDCLYPYDRNPKTAKLFFDCPEASLLDAGIDRCEWTRTREAGFDECRYVCDPRHESGKTGDERPPEVTFDLPARVRFRRPRRDDVWIESIQYGNQILLGFVPPEDRHVEVDLVKWGDLNRVLHRPAAEIHDIVVRGLSGDSHYLKLKDNQQILRVDLPGVRCEETVAYQIRGERRHEEVVVTVKDGRIELEHPETSEEVFRPVIFGGGAGIFTFLLDRQAQASHQTPAEPLLVIGGALDFRPPGWPFTFAPQYAFLFGPQTYFPIADPGGASSVRPERVPYARHLLDVAAFYMPWQPIQFGTAIGVLLGHSLFDTDRTRVGDLGVAFVWTPLLLRLRLNDRWSVEGAERLLFGEEIYQFESDFLGAPRSPELTNVRFATDVRLRFSI